MELRGTLTTSTAHRKLLKSPVVSVAEDFRVELLHNDVPVTLFYKHGNYPWRSVLINDVFSEQGIPRHSDIYLMCSVCEQERVDYKIRY